jgi:hypothetical protein
MKDKAVLADAYEPARKALERRLRAYYNYYSVWSRPFEHTECNPCGDHLYTSLSESWLADGVGEHENEFNVRDEAALSSVISQCNNDEVAYFGVLARRFLGLLHASKGRDDESLN